MTKILTVIMILFLPITIFAQEPGLPVGKVFKKNDVQNLSYAEAYYESEKTGNPLVVILTADWCQPCKTLKNTVLSPMIKNGKLKNVSITYVDIEKEEELSAKLRSNNSIPEIIVFKKRSGVWSRRHLIGLQTEQAIEKLIGE
jgi:thioredoxin-like negative regulator of GroEL